MNTSSQNFASARVAGNTLPLALRNGRDDTADLLLGARRTDITPDALVAALQTDNRGMLRKLVPKMEPTVPASALTDLLLFPTSIRGNDAALRELIALMPNPNVRQGGLLPLPTAVSHGVKAAVEALLAHPRIDINATDRSGASALHVAARSGGEAFQNFRRAYEIAMKLRGSPVT